MTVNFAKIPDSQNQLHNLDYCYYLPGFDTVLYLDCDIIHPRYLFFKLCNQIP